MSLVIENLSKSFLNTSVLKNANYTFEPGKIYGLLGRNGAGKTTLFNCIAKDLTYEKGKIYLLTDGVKKDYDSLDISYVYATPHLPSFMTGLEFVRYFIEVNQSRLREKDILATTYLDRVGITKADQGRLLKDYSHGMKNKVQMLVSLIVKPKVLLLDEPLTSFDPVAAKEMKDFILSLKKDTIIIFSTHVLQLAQELCDEVVLLHQKRLISVASEDIHDAGFEEEVVGLLQAGEGENHD